MLSSPQPHIRLAWNFASAWMSPIILGSSLSNLGYSQGFIMNFTFFINYWNKILFFLTKNLLIFCSSTIWAFLKFQQNTSSSQSSFWMFFKFEVVVSAWWEPFLNKENWLFLSSDVICDSQRKLLTIICYFIQNVFFISANFNQLVITFELITKKNLGLIFSIRITDFYDEFERKVFAIIFAIFK